ncbi:MAG TPA: ABC transporter permease [Candidatus Micrarchaeaceae archaeon]|nr:ABC transporter permease [Candidatus Micrarchaeaceae archaeon]
MAAPAVPGAVSRTAALSWLGSAVRWWPLGLIAIWLLVIAVPGLIAPQNPLTLNLSNTLGAPSAQNWFGTDEAGRDLWSRCVWGVRYSLGISIVIVFSAAAIGTLIGGLAGLMRGWIDSLLMRTTDVFLAFPYLILAIAIASAVGPGLTTVVVAMTAVWWPGYARMVRGQVLALKELAFVEGARAAGTSTLMILVRHLLPHLLPQLSARVSMDVGYAVLALTGLSFLGLGAQPPTPELGAIIADARSHLLEAWWYTTLPGLFVLAAVISSMVVSDWLENRTKGQFAR